MHNKIVIFLQSICTLGHLSSHGRPAMTSTASAPPTPTRIPPRPPEKAETWDYHTSYLYQRATHTSYYAYCCVFFFAYLHWGCGCRCQSALGQGRHNSPKQSEIRIILLWPVHTPKIMGQCEIYACKAWYIQWHVAYTYTWCMIPLPGFQKPTPYLEAEEARKS